MEFVDLIHNPEGDIYNFNPDVFIAASGYESRSIVIPKAFGNILCKKIAYAFTEHSKELNRSKNDSFFQENNYELIQVNGDSSPDFEIVFNNFDKDEIKIILDISVMTRKWYHSFLKFINDFHRINKITVRIVYCPAIYNKPARVRRSISLDRFIFHEKFKNVSTNDKEIALIMGLSNETGVSLKMKNLIKPDLTTLLYADPTVQKEYVENVFIANHELIESINIKNLQSYPLNDTSAMYKLLIDIALPLRRDHRIIIVPQGPKIFSFITMLFQLSYPDIELIYPRFKIRQIKDRKPYPEFTYLDVLFGSE